MKHKLLAFFNHSMEQNTPPTSAQLSTFHWFKINIHDGWIGIPKEEMESSQLELLQACYDYYSPDENINNELLAWNQYLYFHGEQPLINIDSLRMVQFSFNGDTVDRHVVESAFDGFIHPSSLIVWNGSKEGVIIEKNNQYLEEDDFRALSHALQSDFYFSIYFYLGKEWKAKANENIGTIFTKERQLFTKGLAIMPSSPVMSMEIILPNLLISRLVEEELTLFQDWFSIFQEDTELLLTIKTFIENNGHSTNTAKQLFIHRNTLQYRLEKFTEKTGIQLKNFNHYLLTYLACLFYTNGKRDLDYHLTIPN